MQGVTAISPTLKSTNFLQNEHFSISWFYSIVETFDDFWVFKNIQFRRKPLQQRFGFLGFFFRSCVDVGSYGIEVSIYHPAIDSVIFFLDSNKN